MVSIRALAANTIDSVVQPFLAKTCYDCHDAESKKGNLDLTELKFTPDDANNFSTWVKIHDRVIAGEMPPAKKPRPDEKQMTAAVSDLADTLTRADRARQKRDGRSRLRRLNRVEFENTLRDLLAMPALKIKDSLPADGKAHGFDRLSDALDYLCLSTWNRIWLPSIMH